TRSLLASLVRGELDLALSETPLPKGPIDAALLCSDPFVVLLQAGAPLARRPRPIATAELARLPLIAHAPSRAHVEEQLRTHGVEARFVLQAETGSGGQGGRGGPAGGARR